MGKRFLTLDAMRGAAAIVVVIYHSAIITNGACTQATCNAPFGYLAVDMFFALSGFVLSHSYDRQFAGGMTAWRFMKARFLRLMPIYWLALLIGLPLAGIDLVKGEQSAGTVLGAAMLNAAILPWNSGITHPYAVALLRPAWSLFFELWVANLVFALFWRQLRGFNLVVLIGLSLAGLAIGARWYGTLDMGPVWSTFPGGFVRVLFSFFLGVALRRLSARMALPALPSSLIVAVTVATFFMPVPPSCQLAFELVCVACLYPILIVAGSRATPHYSGLAEGMGNASYALYLIHMPLLDYWTKAIHRLGIAPHPAMAGSFVLAALLVALAVHRYYDKWARDHLVALLDRPRRNAARQGTVGASAVGMVPAAAGAALP